MNDKQLFVCPGLQGRKCISFMSFSYIYSHYGSVCCRWMWHRSVPLQVCMTWEKTTGRCTSAGGTMLQKERAKISSRNLFLALKLWSQRHNFFFVFFSPKMLDDSTLCWSFFGHDLLGDWGCPWVDPLTPWTVLVRLSCSFAKDSSACGQEVWLGQ